MTRHPFAQNTRTVTTLYEVRVRGAMSGSVRTVFEDLEITSVPGETILRGDLPDQASLHGVLARAQRLGLELIEIRQVDEAQQEHLD